MDYSYYGGWVWKNRVLQPQKSDVPVFDYDDDFPYKTELHRVEEKYGFTDDWQHAHHIVLGDGLVRLGVTGMRATAYVFYPESTILDPYTVGSSQNEITYHTEIAYRANHRGPLVTITTDYATPASRYMHCTLTDEEGNLWYGEVGVSMGHGFESLPKREPSRLLELLPL